MSGFGRVKRSPIACLWRRLERSGEVKEKLELSSLPSQEEEVLFKL